MTVPDRDLFRWSPILHPHLVLTALDRDAVVADREINADDPDIGAGFGIAAIGVGRILRTFKFKIDKIDILREIGVEIP